jgi:hypothetical protein
VRVGGGAVARDAGGFEVVLVLVLLVFVLVDLGELGEGGSGGARALWGGEGGGAVFVLVLVEVFHFDVLVGCTEFAVPLVLIPLLLLFFVLVFRRSATIPRSGEGLG